MYAPIDVYHRSLSTGEPLPQLRRLGKRGNSLKAEQRTPDQKMTLAFGKLRVPIVQPIELFVWTAFDVYLVL